MMKSNNEEQIFDNERLSGIHANKNDDSLTKKVELNKFT